MEKKNYTSISLASRRLAIFLSGKEGQFELNICLTESILKLYCKIGKRFVIGTIILVHVFKANTISSFPSFLCLAVLINANEQIKRWREPKVSITYDTFEL